MSKQDNELLWYVMTSANLSNAAWGKLRAPTPNFGNATNSNLCETTKGGDDHYINNSEVGVFIAPSGGKRVVASTQGCDLKLTARSRLLDLKPLVYRSS